jgi:RimJ/RimL family protein N-acetyltransferase
MFIGGSVPALSLYPSEGNAALLKSRVTVRIAHVRDAASIAECFDLAYGGTYPLSDFTRPEPLARRLTAGTTVFAVATHDEEVVAAVALEPKHDRTGEFGHGVVKEQYRGLDLFHRLHEPLIERAKSLGLGVVFSHCVTSHTRSQRPMPRLGALPIGLSLAAAPTSIKFVGLREELFQRESFLDFAFLLSKRRRVAVHVSRDLREKVEEVYGAIGVRCVAAPSCRRAEALTFVVEDNPELGTATLRYRRVRLPEARSTLPPYWLERRACLYAEIPLGSRDAPRATASLRKLGFSFAGILPWRGDDVAEGVLVLQRPRELPAPELIEIGVPEGEALKSLVFEDLYSVRDRVLAKEESWLRGSPM